MSSTTRFDSRTSKQYCDNIAISMTLPWGLLQMSGYTAQSKKWKEEMFFMMVVKVN